MKKRFAAIAITLALFAFWSRCNGRQDEEPSLSESIKRWVSVYLEAMDEPALANSSGETYRFLWIPSFSKPIAVRATCDATTCEIVAKQLNQMGGLGPGVLSRETSRVLSNEEWRLLMSIVDETRFWEISQEKIHAGMGPQDASLWVLEGKKFHQHQFWSDWSVIDIGEDIGLRSVCLKLLEFSELGLELSKFD